MVDATRRDLFVGSNPTPPTIAQQYLFVSYVLHDGAVGKVL